MSDDAAQSGSMEPRDVWKTIGQMQGQIQETREAVFGYWDGPKRVKGLLENQADLIGEFSGWKDALIHFGWSIGKPILALLGVLVALGFIAVAIVAYFVVHGGIHVSI